MTSGPQSIVANSVLPARRDPLRLHTSDGLSLVGELALPVAVAPVATIVCVHPLPEGLDLAAAIAEVTRRGLPDPWLVGWSFGTDVVLKHGDVDPVLGAILLSPPLRHGTDADLAAWAAGGRPVVALVPEFDDYLVPDEARRRFSVLAQAQVRAIDGAKHLWVGERFVKIVLDSVVGIISPDRSPLPGEWSGPMDRWSDV